MEYNPGLINWSRNIIIHVMLEYTSMVGIYNVGTKGGVQNSLRRLILGVGD